MAVQCISVVTLYLFSPTVTGYATAVRKRTMKEMGRLDYRGKHGFDRASCARVLKKKFLYKTSISSEMLN